MSGGLLRTLAVMALLAVLLVLLGMSFLRINNLEYDVSVLQKEVARLSGAGAPPAAAATPSPAAPAAAATASPLAAMPPAALRPVGSPPPAPGTVEGVTGGYLDEGAEVQSVALPAGFRPPRAQVAIVAVEGEGVAAKPLPDPIVFTLQAGTPQEVRGICQGPETAAWVFTLEGSSVRVESRGCEYPVRGLRPRLRITAAP